MLLVNAEATSFVMNVRKATRNDLSSMLIEPTRSGGVGNATCVRGAAPKQPALPKYYFGHIYAQRSAAYSDIDERPFGGPT